MRQEFLNDLITLSVVVYAIRHLVYKLIAIIKPLNTFYKNRMILPSVRVWDSRILHSIYNHIFSIFETIVFTLLFLSLYRLTGSRNYFLVVYIFYTIITVYKEIYFARMLSFFPKSLLIVDIARCIILSTVSFLTLYFLMPYLIKL